MKKTYLYRIHFSIIAAVAFAGLSIHAMGATRTWSGGDNNWDNDASWGGTEPVSGDLASVNNGNTVTVNLSGEIAGALSLSGGSTVNVESNGVLALDAVAQSYSLSLVGGGTLNVSGGSLTVSGVVNNYLNNSGVINVSAGSASHTASNLRFGDSSTTGTLAVSGSGSWSNGSLNIIGTGNINLTGSTARISGVAINNNAGAALNVNLTPGSAGMNAIGCSSLNLTSTDTLNFNTDGYLGARTVVLFNYSGARTSTFNTTNITRTGVGNLTLGSNPGGKPDYLGENEYYLDNGDGSADSVTLYYNTMNTTGLVAHYSLDGNLNDDGGYGYNGTFQGTGGTNSSATFVPDSKFGAVLEFDGTDDRIYLGSIPTLSSNSWSISMWVKTPATTNTVPLLGKSDGDTSWETTERLFEITGAQTWDPISTNAGSFAVCGWGCGGVTAQETAIDIDNGRWHMLTAVHDNSVGGTNMTLYIDGMAQGLGPATYDNNAVGDGTTSWYLGFGSRSIGNSVPATNFPGQMAEVSFYNVAIDASTVRSMYDAFAQATVIMIR